MKTLLTVALILTFCSFADARNKYFSLKTYKIRPDIYERTYEEGNSYTYNAGEAESDQFSFPIFSKRINNYSANKINQTMQISELEILKGFETKSIFERVSYDGGGIYGNKVSIKFDVFDNTNRVLSVQFNQTSCGATCAYWVKYYNFNSGNGDLIQLKDLFTEKGYEKFFAFVTNRRLAQVKDEIRRKVEPKYRESFFESISNAYKVDDLTDFYIKDNNLYIDGENSFSKNAKFEGIETVSKFNLSEFKSHLNDYGKSIFGLNNKAVKKYRSKVLPQLFQGKIGNQNVVLFLNTGYEKEMKAEYVYSKYGKGVFLEGKLENNKLSLTEKLPKPNEKGFTNYVDNGFIEADFDGQNMTRIWRNSDKTKTFDLKLSRK